MDIQEDGLAEQAATSVDDVHDLLDTLMLSVFNTVRGHGEVSGDGSNITAVQQANAAVIHESLIKTLAAVDHLAGMQSTQVQQEQILREQSQQISTLKQRILQLEEQMRTRRRDIDAQLNGALSNAALRLS